jgi:YVTN family beta-propeller protein
MRPISPLSAGNPHRRLRANRQATRSAIFAVGLGAMVCPGEAIALAGQPLAYITSSNGIAVVDTGDNQIVDTIPAAPLPAAVTPDGKHVYAFAPNNSDFVFNISVIDTTNDQVVATIPLDVSRIAGGISLNQSSSGIAVTPDGKTLYVTTGLCSSSSFDCIRPESVYYALWVIDTATNQVVSTDGGKGVTDGIAFSPDGQHVYFTNYDPYFGSPQVLDNGTAIPLTYYAAVYSIAITPDGTRAYVPYSFPTSTAVAVIDTMSDAVTQNIPIGPTVFDLTTLTQVAVTPDGKHAYVTSQAGNNVSVIDTASNAIVQTIVVGTSPSGVAVTPDGAHVYVSNRDSNNVSVIDTSSNSVTATVPISAPGAISIVPPPQGVPFLSFNARLIIHLGRKPDRDAFELESSFKLNASASDEIHPDTEPVKLQVGPFLASFPIGSFKPHGDRSYTFAGVIDGARLHARIERTGTQRYRFLAEAREANLSGITNPVQVSLSIGNDTGLTSVNALRLPPEGRERALNGEK